MTLKFDNGYEERIIGYPTSSDEAHKIMRDFMKERNYKCYYIRSWTDDKKVTTFDVGCHTQFFKLYLE